MRIIVELLIQGLKTQRKNFVGTVAVEEGWLFIHASRDEEHPLCRESLEGHSSQHDHRMAEWVWWDWKLGRVTKSDLRTQPKLNTLHLVSNTLTFYVISFLIIWIVHVYGGSCRKYKSNQYNKSEKKMSYLSSIANIAMLFPLHM